MVWGDHYVPEPGTEEAAREGCTCQVFPPSRWGFDPDHTVKRDEWCPIHGRDPDDAADQRREDAEFRAQFPHEDDF